MTHVDSRRGNALKSERMSLTKVSRPVCSTGGGTFCCAVLDDVGVVAASATPPPMSAAKRAAPLSCATADAEQSAVDTSANAKQRQLDMGVYRPEVCHDL